MRIAFLFLSLVGLFASPAQAQSQLVGQTMYLQGVYKLCDDVNGCRSRFSHVGIMIYFANDGRTFVFFTEDQGVVLPMGETHGRSVLKDQDLSIPAEVKFIGWPPTFRIALSTVWPKITIHYSFGGNATIPGCELSDFTAVETAPGVAFQDVRPVGCSLRRGRHPFPANNSQWPLTWPK